LAVRIVRIGEALMREAYKSVDKPFDLTIIMNWQL
jgi:hypothetical protein